MVISIDVELEKIAPNPFQTRDSEDQEHINNLADSIQKNGLLQVPTARQVDGNLYQLAFGHSRFKAYKFLTESGVEGFAKMPLRITELTDEQMFESAVSENRERKDLTPIEEARAMLMYREKFGKNSEEIGKLFHLSDSAVRGKIRLLDLPEEIKVQVGKTITEGAARDLLVFYDLPDEMKNVEVWSQKHGHISFQKDMEQDISEGVTSEYLHDKIDRFVDQRGKNMSDKPWKSTDELIGEGIIGLCKGCEFMLKRDHDYCLKNACFDAKTTAWRRQYLLQASLLSGIRVIEEDGDHTYVTDFSYGAEVKFKQIKKAQCENLRLVFDQYHSGHPETSDKIGRYLGKEGFPGAKVVCLKRSGSCTCLKAMEAGLKLDTENGVEGTKEDLKELNRQKKEQEKIDNELIEHMINQTSIAIEQELGSSNPLLWMAILYHLEYGKYQELKKQPIEVIALNVKEAIANRLVRVTLYQQTKEAVLHDLNRRLVECGLPPLDISFQCDVPPTGKTLIEVFADESPAEDLTPGKWHVDEADEFDHSLAANIDAAEREAGVSND
jgi:ParB/RepB/Spo0J family partition protein